MVGASRERVNKAIAVFLRLGWIEVEGRNNYRILDRESLDDRASLVRPGEEPPGVALGETEPEAGGVIERALEEPTGPHRRVVPVLAAHGRGRCGARRSGPGARSLHDGDACSSIGRPRRIVLRRQHVRDRPLRSARDERVRRSSSPRRPGICAHAARSIPPTMETIRPRVSVSWSMIAVGASGTMSRSKRSKASPAPGSPTMASIKMLHGNTNPQAVSFERSLHSRSSSKSPRGAMRTRWPHCTAALVSPSASPSSRARSAQRCARRVGHRRLRVRHRTP